MNVIDYCGWETVLSKGYPPCVKLLALQIWITSSNLCYC